MRILLLNGPNLNMLGTREPHIYGATTLGDIEQALVQRAQHANAHMVCVQSNHEGVLIDTIQREQAELHGIIINPGALTHYSYALRDALSAVSCPIIEVHISNVYKRETFRHHSVIAPIATGQIAGLGWHGYVLALDWLLTDKKSTS
ncbi:MAG: hypothetical protein RL076_2126 [Chloroflexota bacterium]|jgi:3-dehydroquinate dehydratase-2